MKLDMAIASLNTAKTLIKKTELEKLKTIKVSDELYEQLKMAKDMLNTIDKEDIDEVKKYTRRRRTKKAIYTT